MSIQNGNASVHPRINIENRKTRTVGCTNDIIAAIDEKITDLRKRAKLQTRDSRKYNTSIRKLEEARKKVLKGLSIF